MGPIDDDSVKLTKRDMLVTEYLNKLGIMSVNDAPDELIDEAHEAADKILGKGNDN